MRKRAAWAVLCLVLFAAPARADGFAATEDFFKACGNKILRGAADVLTGWVEVVNQPVKKTWRDGPVSGLTLGLLKGVWYGIGRTAHGAVELATFPLPNHQSNEDVGVPLDAEFSWEEGAPARQYGQPIGNKLVRGVIDLFTFWLELPAQPAEGTRQRGAGHGCTVGLVKGIWFTLGRAASGVQETALFFFPNPVDTAGYPFSNLRAWEGFRRKGPPPAKE